MSDQTGTTPDDVKNNQEVEKSQKRQLDISNQLLDSFLARKLVLQETSEIMSKQEKLAGTIKEALAEDMATIRKETKETFGGIVKAFSQIKKSKMPLVFKSIAGPLSAVNVSFKAFSRIVGHSADAFVALQKASISVLSKVGDAIKGMFDAITSHPIVKIAVAIYKSLEKIGKLFGTIFFGGIKYGTKFVKFMAGLPLKIAGLSAKIGNSLRNDLVMTIGTAVESTKEMFDISEKFGSGAGGAIKSFSDSASASMLHFRDITSDSVKLFGEGAAGIAARAQAVSQRLSEMGVYADIFGESLAASADGSAVQFEFMEKSIRALGMTAEDVAYTAQEAAKRGVGINTVLMETQISLKNVAKSSGVNAKTISKNFLVLRRDIINFGHLTTEQLQQTSAELVKMGLSAQDAAAMFGKLDTFESAAQMSAMLSQSFGMNLDALKLIKSENPQEIFEDLRDSMMSTGRSFQELNRHEKSLMATTTGLSATSLKALMDFRDAGMSYEEAMKKMKENSPEEKQLKAFNDMSGSLKEIKNIMQDTSFFSSFFKGLRTSLVLATGLGEKFQAVSKRMEDVYLGALSFGKNPALMKSFRSAFKPIEDTIDTLIGKNNKGGIFDVKKLKGIEKFMTKFTGFLGKAFKDKSNVISLQNDFSYFIKKSFDADALLRSSNNPATSLIKAGGKLVGQFLKGVAVIGPGLIDFVGDGLEALVNWLTGEAEFFGGSRISQILADLFGLNENDQKGLLNTYEKLVERIIGSGGPLARLLTFMSTEVVKLASSAAMKIGESIFENMLGYNSNAYQVFKQWALFNPFGQLLRVFGLFDMGPFKTQEGIFEEAVEKSTAGLKNLDLTTMMGNNTDEKQAQDIGKLYSSLKREQKNVDQYSKEGVAIQNLIDKIDKQIAQPDLLSLRDDSTIKDIVKDAMAIRGDEKTIKIKSANDWLSDMFGGSGKAVVQQSASGTSITSLASGDQILAGMEGGPIVNAIRYSGDAVSQLINDITGMVSSKSGRNVNIVQQQSQTQRPIELVINMDGEVVARKLVAADIIGKAKDPSIAKGATVLNDRSTRNQSGGSNEISALG